MFGGARLVYAAKTSAVHVASHFETAEMPRAITRQFHQERLSKVSLENFWVAIGTIVRRALFAVSFPLQSGFQAPDEDSEP